MFDLIPFERSDSFANQLFRALGVAPLFGKADIPCLTDIRDAGDHYELEAEMPGFKKEEIHISTEGGCLTLTANHEESADQKDEKENYIRRERRTARMSRSFDLTGVDAEKIRAQFENGVLKLTLPKKEEVKPAPKQIAIQ